MSGQHTPGPWSVSGQPDKVCAEGFTNNGAAKTIATASSPSWMLLDEPAANARLIAAAPDLLAALRITRKRLYEAMLIIGSSPEFATEGCREADAAFAKAEGRS